MSYGFSTSLSLEVLSMTSQTSMQANCSENGPTPKYWPPENELNISQGEKLSALTRETLAAWAENIGLATLLLNQNALSTSPAVPKLLSQMFQSIPLPNSTAPTSPAPNHTMPFIAEGISALLASFLVESTHDSAFKLNWDTSSDPPILSTPRNGIFNATLSGAEFRAGPVVPWRGVFHVALLLVFVGNLGCLGYFVFVLKRGLGVDCTEPQNAFAFAVAVGKGSDDDEVRRRRRRRKGGGGGAYVNYLERG